MNPSTYAVMPDISINVSGVHKLLSDLNPFKATGPDAISARFLKETANELAPMLTCLFNQSLTTGDIPQDWKKSYVIPIHKKGSKTDPKNFRPVSLTSIICKTMEHILSSQIMHHIESQGIICETQFGFRQNHSCETQLLLTVDDFARAMDHNIQVDVGILDMSKAFNKVPHEGLALKLHHYGIRGNVLTWLQSFLKNRSQQVVVDGYYSTPCDVISGVPQGSVLGPTLFLIYINDIAADIQSTIRLFADDCLIYRLISSPEDHYIPQEDLNRLTVWAATWQMNFNVDKCNIMQFSSARHKRPFTYTMQGLPLCKVDHHSYLGVVLDHKLSWEAHQNYVCNKVNRLLAFLNRNLPTYNQHLRENSYKQLVLPVLDYCATIWDPHYHNAVHRIEMLQNRAAHFVLNRPWRKHYHDSVSSMISVLNSQPLQVRRRNS